MFVRIALDGILYEVRFPPYYPEYGTYSHRLRKRPYKQRGNFQCERHVGLGRRASPVLGGAIGVIQRGHSSPITVVYFTMLVRKLQMF